jgi:hypothetical protein
MSDDLTTRVEDDLGAEPDDAQVRAQDERAVDGAQPGHHGRGAGEILLGNQRRVLEVRQLAGGRVRPLSSGHACIDQRMTRIDERDESVREHRVELIHVEFHAHRHAALGTGRGQQERAAVAVRFEAADDGEDRVQQRRPFEV